ANRPRMLVLHRTLLKYLNTQTLHPVPAMPNWFSAEDSEFCKNVGMPDRDRPDPLAGAMGYVPRSVVSWLQTLKLRNPHQKHEHVAHRLNCLIMRTAKHTYEARTQH